MIWHDYIERADAITMDYARRSSERVLARKCAAEGLRMVRVLEVVQRDRGIRFTYELAPVAA